MSEISSEAQVLRITDWRCGVSSEFVKLPLQFILDFLHGQTSQTTVKHLSAKQVNGIEIPLPPLAEQHRIVAKVDELMALCDRLEAARAQREAARNRLTAASLARFSTPDPETFSDDARFALDVFPALTARTDQLDDLRRTIRRCAVMGRLVAQEVDEPAPPLPVLRQAADATRRADFAIPSSWRWVRLSDVAEARLGKMLDKAKNSGQLYPYLRNTNVHWFDIRSEDLKTIALAEHELDEYRLKHGDVLICEGGHGIGRTAVWRGDVENMVFQKALHRVRPGSHLDPDFFALCCFVYFDTGVMQTYFTGVGIPHFTGKALAQLVFPLPPIGEQRRIVAKARELMAMCEQLETSLSTTFTYRARLLETLLNQTLEQTSDCEGHTLPVEAKAC